ncbi:MAG: hypothetical protein GY938_03965 [Ketobacter sp.]|nr:hypothetical protein [Ketobacter sp.]
MREPAYRLSILTKSDLVLRDLDLLTQMDCVVQFSIAVLYNKIQRVVEPQAPSTKRRLDAIRILEAGGVKTSVRLKPVLPFDLACVKDIVDIAAEVTSGKIYVQGIDIGKPYLFRIAEIAQQYFPDKLERWLSQPEKIAEERAELVSFLKHHERVHYERIDDAYISARQQIAQANFRE